MVVVEVDVVFVLVGDTIDGTDAVVYVDDVTDDTDALE